MTLAQLMAIMPFAGQRATLFLAPLNAAMAEFARLVDELDDLMS